MFLILISSTVAGFVRCIVVFKGKYILDYLPELFRICCFFYSKRFRWKELLADFNLLLHLLRKRLYIFQSSIFFVLRAFVNNRSRSVMVFLNDDPRTRFSLNSPYNKWRMPVKDCFRDTTKIIQSHVDIICIVYWFPINSFSCYMPTRVTCLVIDLEVVRKREHVRLVHAVILLAYMLKTFSLL